MRSPLDRLRHALSFEIIALLIVVPLGALIFGISLHDTGVVALVSATLATLWNLAYNYLFDLGLKRLTGSTWKTTPLRLVHAVLFEVGLLFVLMPFIAWYLDISLWHAFVMDVSFAAFYMVYAFAFNWAYDRLFPLPEWHHDSAANKAS
ncbi:PACE efflux transporter [Shimia sp. FJ5]|uniref:PACE efflux transporter n=1 Tax=Shimia sp. FJ5 TaxID=3079054 RepID=UPI00262E9C9A|nr:PACE efflux transporter [Shimia sp. FJ5]MDV4145741.1 PACE efflux transporter [Shimia sp. FJ5]